MWRDGSVFGSAWLGRWARRRAFFFCLLFCLLGRADARVEILTKYQAAAARRLPLGGDRHFRNPFPTERFADLVPKPILVREHSTKGKCFLSGPSFWPLRFVREFVWSPRRKPCFRIAVLGLNEGLAVFQRDRISDALATCYFLFRSFNPNVHIGGCYVTTVIEIGRQFPIPFKIEAQCKYGRLRTDQLLPHQGSLFSSGIGRALQLARLIASENGVGEYDNNAKGFYWLRPRFVLGSLINLLA